jgi:hypothetical protein
MDFCRQFDLSTRPLPELSSSGDSDDGKEPDAPENMSIEHLENLQREQHQQLVAYDLADGTQLTLDQTKLVKGNKKGQGKHLLKKNDPRKVLQVAAQGTVVEREGGGVTTCFASQDPDRVINGIIPHAFNGTITNFEELPDGRIAFDTTQEAWLPGQDPRGLQRTRFAMARTKMLTAHPVLENK